jgi:hypothetical protein
MYIKHIIIRTSSYIYILRPYTREGRDSIIVMVIVNDWIYERNLKNKKIKINT